ncbi:DinB family protein [Lentibacillus salicampi]|uniref:Damage-inducible protein DinB n=1 Tax=Lentibacillus salicampi TaxID=175306 RepID=A0A4Y9AIA6_9BACI|nr:DinB family protein [Lentibacillus salicampi]TFJ94154.1 damage-inducible protein DinB [Lentibacillus salicampi]
MSNGMEGAVNGWLQHRMVLDDLLALVDDTNVDYRPWDGAMSLGELAIHIVTSTHMFVKGIKKGEFDMPPTENYKTINDIRTIVQRYTEETKEEMSTIFTYQMKGYILFNKVRAPGTYWFSNAIDHEIHHKGQLFTYVRMIGAKEVPNFIRQPDEI